MVDLIMGCAVLQGRACGVKVGEERDLAYFKLAKSGEQVDELLVARPTTPGAFARSEGCKLDLSKVLQE